MFVSIKILFTMHMLLQNRLLNMKASTLLGPVILANKRLAFYPEIHA